MLKFISVKSGLNNSYQFGDRVASEQVWESVEYFLHAIKYEAQSEGEGEGVHQGQVCDLPGEGWEVKGVYQGRF